MTDMPTKGSDPDVRRRVIRDLVEQGARAGLSAPRPLLRPAPPTRKPTVVVKQKARAS